MRSKLHFAFYFLKLITIFTAHSFPSKKLWDLNNGVFSCLQLDGKTLKLFLEKQLPRLSVILTGLSPLPVCFSWFLNESTGQTTVSSESL